MMSKEEKFVQLIQQHQGLIFKITSVYMDNKPDREDLYQDIVYQLWKSFDSFRNESKISTWMYRIALNTALTKIKQGKRNPSGNGIENFSLKQPDDYDDTFEQQLKEVYVQINQLNVLDKGIMLMLLDGKKYEEIAEVVGISASNVGTRISRIKQKLKNNIVKK